MDDKIELIFTALNALKIRKPETIEDVQKHKLAILDCKRKLWELIQESENYFLINAPMDVRINFDI